MCPLHRLVRSILIKRRTREMEKLNPIIDDETSEIMTNEGELTTVQKTVLAQLTTILPNHAPAMLLTSVSHSSNLVEPLDTDMILQSCLDDVMEGRTAQFLYTRSGKSYKAPLTIVQHQVQSQLEQLFPNLTSSQIRCTLLDPKNLCHSLHEDILLQQCVDMLLVDRLNFDVEDFDVYPNDGEEAKDVIVTGAEPEKKVLITGCELKRAVPVASTSVCYPGSSMKTSAHAVEDDRSLEGRLSADINLLQASSRNEETMDFDDAFDEELGTIHSNGTVELNDGKKGNASFDMYSTRTILDSDSESLGTASDRTTPETEDELPQILFPKTRDWPRSPAIKVPETRNAVADPLAGLDISVSIGGNLKHIKDKPTSEASVKNDNENNNSSALSVCTPCSDVGSMPSIPPRVGRSASPRVWSPTSGGSGTNTKAQTTVQSSNRTSIPLITSTVIKSASLGALCTSPSISSGGMKQTPGVTNTKTSLLSSNSLFTQHAQNITKLISSVDTNSTATALLFNRATSLFPTSLSQNIVKTLTTTLLQNSQSTLSTSVTTRSQNRAMLSSTCAKTLSANSIAQNSAKSRSTTNCTLNNTRPSVSNHALVKRVTIGGSAFNSRPGPVTIGTGCKATCKHCLCAHCLSRVKSDISGHVPLTGTASAASVGKGSVPLTGPTSTVSIRKESVPLMGPTSVVCIRKDSVPLTGPTSVVSIRKDNVPLMGPTSVVSIRKDSVPLMGPTSVVSIRKDSVPLMGSTSVVSIRKDSVPLMWPTSAVRIRKDSVSLTGPTSAVRIRKDSVPLMGPTSVVSIRKDSVPLMGPTSVVCIRKDSVPLMGPTSAVSIRKDNVPLTGPTSAVSIRKDNVPLMGPTSVVSIRKDSVPLMGPTSVVSICKDSVPLMGPTSVVSIRKDSVPLTVPTSAVHIRKDSVPLTGPTSAVGAGVGIDVNPCVSVTGTKREYPGTSAQLPVSSTRSPISMHTLHRNDISKLKSNRNTFNLNMNLSGDRDTDKNSDIKRPPTADDNLREMLAAARALATANLLPTAEAIPEVRHTKKKLANTETSNSPFSRTFGSLENGRNTTVTIESTHKITYSSPDLKGQGNPNVQLPKRTVVPSRAQDEGPAIVLPTPEIKFNFPGPRRDDASLIDVDLEMPLLSLMGDPEPIVVQDHVLLPFKDDAVTVVDVDRDVAVQPARIKVEPAPPPLTLEQILEKERITIKNEVLCLFADVEDSYLDGLTRQYSGSLAVNHICNVLLETKYPTAPKVPAAAEAVSTSDGDATSSPEDIDWYDPSVNINPSYSFDYSCQSRNLLFEEFEWISAKFIDDVRARLHQRYAPVHKVLCRVWALAQKAAGATSPSGVVTNPAKYRGLSFPLESDSGNLTGHLTVTLLKARRPRIRMSKLNMCPDLLKEMEFVKMKTAAFKTAADHQVALQMNEDEYENEGQLIECGCCYGEVPFENMVQCSDGHLFCRDCLKQYAQESIFGQGKAALSCMTGTCKSTFPTSQLERALPSELLQRYEDRVKEESLNLADLGDLVRCPSCEFAALMDPGDKVFRCQNAKCMKETCRHCKEEWAEHFGKRCDEIEKKDETKLRLEYEEKMTKAKVRTCFRCKSQFMKEDGCNKMTCRCGAKMCYICRKPDIDYGHFCRHPRDPGKTCTMCDVCSLWTNGDEDDNRAIQELQKEAEQKRKNQGYQDDKLIGAPSGSPPAKKAKKANARPPPLQIPL